MVVLCCFEHPPYDVLALSLHACSLTSTGKHLRLVQELTLLGTHHAIGTSSVDMDIPSGQEHWHCGCLCWLQKLTSLQSLHCPSLHDEDPDLFVRGLQSCLQPLQQLTQLDLTGVEGGVDFQWAEAANLPPPWRKALQCLSLNTLHACDITTDAVLALAQPSSLTRLQLTGGLTMLDLQVCKHLLWDSD